MSQRSRIYLDFDGVICSPRPGVQHFHLLAVDGDCLPASKVQDLQEVSANPLFEVVWATHREDAVYAVTDELKIPRFPHLTFTDPTGSKVKDIISYYQAHPCESAWVYEDSLTRAEIQALNAAGMGVRLFENCIHQSYHPATKENQ